MKYLIRAPAWDSEWEDIDAMSPEDAVQDYAQSMTTYGSSGFEGIIEVNDGTGPVEYLAIPEYAITWNVYRKDPS